MDEKNARGSRPEVAERHGRELKAVNEKLRELIDSLRVERERMQRGQDAAAPKAPAPTPVPGADQARTLASELAAVREDLESRRAEEERLRQRLLELEQENRRLYDEVVGIAEQTTRLANLYVAMARLHGTLDHAEVLAAIEEIVITMVGSEELAVFELDPTGRELRPTRAFGLPPARLTPIALGAGDIGRIAASGRLFLAGNGEQVEDPDLSACVPLRVGGAVTGAIAIFRLLGHKPVLGPSDRELLELLSTQAAAALHVTAEHAARPG